MSSPTPMPLNSSTSHCLLTAFLVRFVGGGEGISGDSSGEGLDAGAQVAGAQAGSAIKPIGLVREGCD
jgi:hypothetical protein